MRLFEKGGGVNISFCGKVICHLPNDSSCLIHVRFFHVNLTKHPISLCSSCNFDPYSQPIVTVTVHSVMVQQESVQCFLLPLWKV